MSCIVPRTCTEVPPDDAEPVRRPVSRPLADFRTAPAYVLLGDPGCGKSTSFEAERDVLGEEASPVIPAGDFLDFDLREHPEWRGKTLFIDGLDEVRAWGGDARTPLGTLRGRIDALGRPSFRLSCREADWLGTNDRSKLARVAPDGKLAVLRLDPLTDQDATRILATRSGIDDARSFVARAREQGVAAFLDNPLCLNLLADAVAGGGGWPASRRELFEQACREMVREANREHIAAAGRSSPSALIPDELLDAAGRLCAVLLISGAAGCALSPHRVNADYPGLDRCVPERREPARQAVSTKLFRAVAEGRFKPIHRHVAEFLAGRHLARLIDGERRGDRRVRHGVPARRVVALMTGHDGGVVTELRGLSAWIAAHGGSARSELFKRDPTGVGLYGDIGQFSAEERGALLACLRGQASRLAPASRTAAAFKSLATPEMEAAFKELLTDSGRTHEQQVFVHFLVSVLAQGGPLPGLSDILLGIARDETLPTDLSARALDAFIHNCADGTERTLRLRELLADVQRELIPDPDGQLLGTLLMQLYPDELPPSAVWDYLSEAPNPAFWGRYFFFWKHRIVESSAAEEVAELLDAMAARQDALWPVLESRGLQDVPVRLVARGLEALGDQVETSRLYDWLGAGLITDLSRLSDDNLAHVRGWLGDRPATQKEIFVEGTRRCAALDDETFWRGANETERRLYGSARPADFGAWCLEQAETAADRRIAKYFLRYAMSAVSAPNDGHRLSLDVMERWVQARPILAGVYAELQCGEREMELVLRRHERRRRRHDVEDELEHQERLAYIRSHGASLRENCCPPALLHQLAAAYYGLLIEADGDAPTARLRNLFGDDERLTEAALMGLRGTIYRADLPDVGEIIHLQDQQREHYLALPALVSLQEMECTAPEELSRLDTDLKRKALAFHYCTRGLDEPAWYRRLVESQPALVADLLIRSATPGIRNRREHVAGLSALAHDHQHARIARMASLTLLRAFPTRCAARQMTDLCYLIWSAIRHADPAALLDLIADKLSRASMDVAQRARWLAAGLILSPTTYREMAEEFAAGKERRVRHLFALFDHHPLQLVPIERLGVPALQLVIRLAASTFGPWASSATGGVTRVTPDMSAAERVQSMIRGLADIPTREASSALEALAADPALSRWRRALRCARDDQRVIRRDAAYRHPDIDQVCRTPSDGAPANAEDLAALVMDRLDEIADRIRNGNTDEWHNYWNEDSHGRPTDPKPENTCRKVLLSDLRQCLPAEVDAQPEGHYANDRRADIRVSCRDFQIPVEIKKNGHRNLWSALRDQLIARYVRDPATDGHGIYLVFWFGETDGCRTPPPATGTRPGDPEALRMRLEESLTPDEARKISVRVIDVSAPTPEVR